MPPVPREIPPFRIAASARIEACTSRQPLRSSASRTAAQLDSLPPVSSMTKVRALDCCGKELVVALELDAKEWRRDDAIMRNL